MGVQVAPPQIHDHERGIVEHVNARDLNAVKDRWHVELNIDEMATDPDDSALGIEARIYDLVSDLKQSVTIPIAVKLGPFFTAFGHVARQQVRCSLAVTGGVATPVDGIKSILAGAHAVQLVSGILRHGPGYFGAMRDGLVRWMESKSFSSIDQVRGLIDGRATEANLFERASYIRTLQSWTAARP